ncbi:MAG TPA: N-acetylmuramoyl-L-alanine amidase [Arsenophonus nasoniae]|uniref:N-acetylmuramoyl-L-alanine amidase n=1 Tax=Arsenophonus nasoniae TaxID=638 RepID=UPI00387A44DF
MYSIDYNSYRSVKSFNRRVRFLVIHYTSSNFKRSVNTLTGNSVSSHYLVPDPSDQTYIDAGFKDMRVFNLVDENERSWHAGVSEWAGRSNLNDTSIGIETVNLAKDNHGVFTFPPFHPQQIKEIIKLAKNILQRYPDISPVNVLGHSDIAPGRKSDPGAAFPWKELYEAGVGAWPDSDTVEKYVNKFTSQAIPERSVIINLLNKYGYSVKTANTEGGFKAVLRVFQLHFRQNKYDGELDIETAAILAALAEKYKGIQS